MWWRNFEVAQWVANWLPRRVVYFCAVRVGAHATTGAYGHQVVPDLYLDARDRGADISAREVLAACALATVAARITASIRPVATRLAARVAAREGQDRVALRLLRASVHRAATLEMPYQEALSNVRLAELRGAPLDERRRAIDRAAALFAALRGRGDAPELAAVRQEVPT